MSNTLSNINNSAMFALDRHAEAMIKLQEQASTGSKVNRPSDDPIAANKMLGLKSTQAQLNNYIENIDEVISTLEYSSFVTKEVAERLSDARNLLTQVTSGTYNSDDRSLTAIAINEMLDHVLDLVNSEHRDQYLFSGTATKTQPYQVQMENGSISSVEYAGSDLGMNVKMSSSIKTTVYSSGDDIFSMSSRAVPEFMGSTGVAVGAGTSSVTGFTWLEITHDAVNGQYQLTMNGGLDTYVVPDDGSGSANLAITDSRSGQVLYVDTTNIASEGTILVAAPGTYDVFDTLITVRDICENSQGLSGEQVSEYANYAINILEEMSAHVLNNSLTTGSKIGFLSDVRQNLEDVEFNAESEIASIEQADIAQIAIDLARREVLYQMSLSVTGRMLSMTLLDFIM